VNDLLEEVILVNGRDRPMGTAAKLAAHRQGLLHRAFSVFIVNPAGELLLQRRAAAKYHSPGLWSNACCGHPRPGEATAIAAGRRLAEELGFTCPLRPAGGFVYRAEVPAGAGATALIEHEYDRVFVGVWDGEPEPDPAEVSAWRWVAPRALERALRRAPDRFTPWLPLALPLAEGHLAARSTVSLSALGR
jgi:isopentenyl-diphosphate Delta-isomerase